MNKKDPSIKVAAVIFAVGAIGAHADAARRYVNINLTTGANNGTSWANAYRGTTCLDTANTASVAGDEIWVARGTYKPSQRTVAGNPRSARFNFNGNVSQYGGFVGNETSISQRDALAMRVNPTVLSGDVAGNDGPINGAINLAAYADNVWQIARRSEQTTVTVLDGFTFVGANSDNTPVAGDAVTGALGIDEQEAGNSNGSVAIVQNCQFLRNRVISDGGAGIRFTAGSGGAEAGRLVLTNCFFAGNAAPGLQGGALKITGNSGGHTLLQCVFTGNSAAGGAAVSTGEATFTNCTFSANASTGPNGAVTDSTSTNSLTVQNCIFSGNTRNNGVNDLLAQVDNATSTYSCFHGFAVAGTGNLDFNPYFTDLDGADDVVGTLDDDLRLAYGFGPTFVSCVEGGNNNVNINPVGVGGTQALPSTDINGRPRIADNLLGAPTVDMGAYEASEGIPFGINDRVWKNLSAPGFTSNASAWHAGLPTSTTFNYVRREYITGLEAASLVMAAPASISWGALTFSSAGEVFFSVAPGQLLTFNPTFGGIVVDTKSQLVWTGSATAPKLSCGYGFFDSPHSPFLPSYGLVISGSATQFNVTKTYAEAGSIVNAGAMKVDGARVTCSTFDSTGFLHIDGPLPAGFTSNLVVQESLEVGASLLITGGGVLSSRSARVTNSSANAGYVVIDGAGSRWSVPFFLSVDGGSIDLQNGGSISTGYGAFFFPQGQFRGSGELHSLVVNFGNIAPGVFDEEGADVGAGTISIVGDYEQLGTLEKFGTDSGRLLLDVGMIQQTYEFDRLTVSGRASLGGGLLVEFQGVPPALGASAEILSAGQLANAFDVAYFPAFSADPKDPRFFKLVYSAGLQTGGAGVTLVVDSLASLVDLTGAQNFSVNGSPNGAALGDLDGDGDLDLAVTVPDANPANNGRLVLLFNQTNAGATFAGFQLGAVEYATGREPSSVAIAPVDATAGVEIVVANAGDDNVRVYSNNGGGLFTPGAAVGVGDRPLDVALADVDGDSDLDVVATNNGSDNVALVRNNGLGAFPSPPSFVGAGDEPVDSDPVDLDNDKDIDIVTTNFSGNSVSMSVNDGDGDFPSQSTFAVGSGPTRIVAALLDNNPFPEIVTTDLNGNTVSVLRATGPLTYAPSVQLPVGVQPRSIAAIDLDGDSDLDLAVVANVTGPAVQVLRNDSPAGQLAFAAATPVQAGADPLLVLAGDVDNSGDEDLVTVNDSALLALETGSDNDLSVMLHAPPPPPACAGDANGDSLVNGADLSVLLGQFGQSVAAGTGGDLNGDGVVNGADLSVLLGRFGTSC